MTTAALREAIPVRVMVWLFDAITLDPLVIDAQPAHVALVRLPMRRRALQWGASYPLLCSAEPQSFARWVEWFPHPHAGTVRLCGACVRHMREGKWITTSDFKTSTPDPRLTPSTAARMAGDRTSPGHRLPNAAKSLVDTIEHARGMAPRLDVAPDRGEQPSLFEHDARGLR